MRCPLWLKLDVPLLREAFRLLTPHPPYPAWYSAQGSCRIFIMLLPAEPPPKGHWTAVTQCRGAQVGRKETELASRPWKDSWKKVSWPEGGVGGSQVSCSEAGNSQGTWGTQVGF